ncbi:MAG TPA: serine/threonine-protein kinase [Polyangia bacterium]|nr:serine/threonine-protein kinase [Polyangia bacterium]
MTPNVELGTLLGGTYRLVRRIGTGGMGEVFEATHERLAHRYAVKFLHPGMRDHPEALPRFMREAQVTSRLRHPGIVSVVDFNTLPDGVAYLVMEYLEGEPLGKILARTGPLPLPRVVDITDQLSAALTAAHLEGVVHRDMHPQNVFVMPASSGQGERVKILDFGISKIASISHKITGTSAVLGTPQYMSPEQAEGKTDELDSASDQFSLGAIVYEMLTGRPAFGGSTLASVAYQIVHAAATPIQDVRPELPAELTQVVFRALAKNKKDRFPSVSEFALHFRWTAALPGNPRAPEKPAAAASSLPLASDVEETTAVSALPSGMAEVIRQTTGLPAHPAAPGPAPGSGPRTRASVHSDPTVVSTSPFAADDPSLVSGRPFFQNDPWARRRRLRAAVGNGPAVVGVVVAAVAIGLLLRGRFRSETADTGPAPAPVSAPAHTPTAAAVSPRPTPEPAPPRTAPAPEPAPARAAVPPAREAAGEAAVPAGEAADRKPPSPAHGHARSAAPAPRPVAVAAAPAHAASAPTGGACRITVGSYPWADLWIDGSNTGLQTPVVDLPLSCGSHRLEFKRRDLNVDQVEGVTVEEGHTFKRQIELQGAGLDE